MKKAIIGLLATAIIAISLLGQGLFQVNVQAEELPAWYKTVNGVLNTDTYSLYPYDTSRRLNIGFSQFGEMINTLDNVGLEYGAVDPFAPPAGSTVGEIVKVNWLQGWLINITYSHRILAQTRTVWASALHGDAFAFGNNWIRVDFDLDRSVGYGLEDPRDPGYFIGNYAGGAGNYGGRKTNGTAVTNPMQVLYDGPRLFVARLVTRIYDHPGYLTDDTSADIPLVELRIYIVFNKAKKEVVLFKELKTLVSDKIADELKIQFSNRGEVDLGNEAAGYDSYFHFYTQGTSRGPAWVGPPPQLPGVQGPRSYENNDTRAEGLPTVYDRNWVMNQTEDPLKSPYYNYTAAGPYPQLDRATYDVAVGIDPAINYTWWAAFWPSLSDWSMDGWDMWWRSIDANDPHDIDSRTWSQPPRVEPSIPFYIGEWDCVLRSLGRTTEQQVRFVTIYGVTDLHDADDENIDIGHTNVIDRETLYLLNEYFNPWDLWSAVEKKTTRWVEFTWGVPTWTSAHGSAVVVPDPMWDQYCEFSERVIDLWPGEELLHRIADDPLRGSAKDYDVAIGEPYGNLTIQGLDPEHYYKILYSTTSFDTFLDGAFPGRYEWGIVGRDAESVDSAGLSLVSAAFKNKHVEYGLAGQDMFEPVIANQMPWVMSKLGGTDTWPSYYYGASDFRVALRDDYCSAGTVEGDEWPISTSNMIGVGGPLANMLAYYGNDFTDALFGLSQFTTFAAWINQVIPLTCWSLASDTHTYASNNTVGYATISTYKDLNGTVLFLIWGHWGRDTYYVTKWFHEKGIYQLQQAPRGVTSIVVKITYENTTEGYKPTGVSIPEVLGTISERLWIHYNPDQTIEYKGGIHDP